jgi:zinc/manganese transport system ATP-binding protein
MMDQEDEMLAVDQVSVSFGAKPEMTYQEGEVLAVDQVSVSFSGRTVLQDVSFKLRAGEFCGLIGANGSGKTTLLRAILGSQALGAGTVRIGCSNGRGGLSSRGSSLGYVPQKISLDPYMPLRARDVVALGLDGHRLGLPLPSRARRSLIDEILKAVNATHFAEQRIGKLSGGEQQRVLIAHALVRRPRLLLLDEPLANLDMRSAAEIVAVLHQLSVKHSITVLLSAHDMNPLLPAMVRVVYLANGRAVSGKTDDVIRTDVLSRLYGYHIDVIRVHGRVLVIAADAPGEIIAAIEKHPAHVAPVP